MESNCARFELNANSVFYRDFDETKIRVCDAVKVLAIVSNLKATQWGKLIEFTNAGGQRKNLAVPMKLLMGTHRYLAAELSLRGLRVDSSMRCMRLLREYLTGEQPQKILLLDCNFLWNKAIFVRPKSEILEMEDAPQNVISGVISESKKSASEEPIISKLKSFLAKNKKFFDDWDNPNSRQLLQIFGYKKKIGGKIFYYVLPKIFKQMVADNPDEINILVENGLLIPSENSSISQLIKLPNGVRRVYAIRGVK